jgi:hypothetical protein
VCEIVFEDMIDHTHTHMYQELSEIRSGAGTKKSFFEQAAKTAANDPNAASDIKSKRQEVGIFKTRNSSLFFLNISFSFFRRFLVFARQLETRPVSLNQQLQRKKTMLRVIVRCEGGKRQQPHHNELQNQLQTYHHVHRMCHQDNRNNNKNIMVRVVVVVVVVSWRRHAMKLQSYVWR